MTDGGPAAAKGPTPPKSAALADANIFVALFAGPEHSHHEEALGLFRRVAFGELDLIVTSTVLAEIVYVARTFLGWSRQEASHRLAGLIEAEGLVVQEKEVHEEALALFGATGGLDFVDAYLVAYARRLGPPAVASFDRDFDGIDGLVRIAS